MVGLGQTRRTALGRRAVTASRQIAGSDPSFGFFLILTCVMAAICVSRIPDFFRFDSVVFGDFGSVLTIDFLVTHGYRPVIDFGYHYGLLPILLAHLWFRIIGRTPLALVSLAFFYNLVFVWGLAKLAVRLRMDTAGRLLLICSLGFMTLSSTSHGLEAVLLCNGLAQQAHRRYDMSLAFACASVFVKPSMGYVYGGLLLLGIFIGLWRTGGDRTSNRVALLAPAAITGIGLSLLLATLYGYASLAETLLPFVGMKAYGVQHFGFFFGSGRYFWHPLGANWKYYLGTVTGLWLASSIYLGIVAGGCASRLWRADSEGHESHRATIDAVVLTCAACQVAFIFLFFGGPFSWFYYVYLIPVGIGAAFDTGYAARVATWCFCGLAILSYKATAVGVYQLWRTTAPSSQTAGLWMPLEEREEWRAILRLTRAHQLLVFSNESSAALLFPGFAPPTGVWLFPGLPNTRELQRVRQQLTRAMLLIVPTMPIAGPVPNWHQLASVLAEFNEVEKGRFFAVYQRNKTAAVVIPNAAHPKAAESP
jgi:hypothetical protein